MGGNEYNVKLKIHAKVGLLRPKKMPKHLLNNSERTLKKSRKRHFQSQKWSKMIAQNAQKGQIFDQKTRFAESVIYFSCCEYTLKLVLNALKNCPKTS